ncbi:DUF4145 domain-containing protein [candidate division KSB1 bacterium]|nr:DUF4145 domain-containing protein [candidate division KSB1 bacterium]
MGPRELAEMDELLDDLGEILSSVGPSFVALQYEDPKTKDFRGRLAELRTRSAELVKNFPRDSFPLVARAIKKFSNRVNLLVADFPGNIDDHKQAIEELKTLWFLQARPEIYRVEMALAVTAGVILPEDHIMFKGKDKYVREITFEINRCFRNGAYNGCSVLMRRLLETLIIQVHEKKGSTATARNSATGHYYKLERLIDDLLATNPFGLSRNALGALPKLKRIGDWGAHNRNILIRESDIEDLKTEARLCFEELIKLA